MRYLINAVIAVTIVALAVGAWAAPCDSTNSDKGQCCQQKAACKACPMGGAPAMKPECRSCPYSEGRSATEDVITMQNGDLLRGEILNNDVNIVTTYGALAIPMRKCARILLADGCGKLQMVVTVNCNRVTGIVTDPVFRIRPAAGGGEIVLHKERIGSIALKRSPNETCCATMKAAPPTDLFFMANGDILTGKPIDPKLAVNTDYGLLTFSLADIKSLEVQGAPATATIIKKDGDIVHGTVQTDDIALRLDIGVETKPIYKDNFVKISVGDGYQQICALHGRSMPTAEPALPAQGGQPWVSKQVAPKPEAPAPTAAPRPGGYLGVEIADVATFAQPLGVPDFKGAYVAKVLPGMAGQRAGLAEKDVIRKINGQVIENAPDLVHKLSGIAPGTAVKLEIWRDEATKEIVATLGSVPSKVAPLAPAPATPPAPQPKPAAPEAAKPAHTGGYLGVALADAQPYVEAIKLPDNKGAFIKAVLPGTPAQKIGLKAGDVIRRLNGQVIESANDLVQRLRSIPAGTKVTLNVWKDRAEHQYEATLAATLPPIPQAAPAPAPAPKPATPAPQPVPKPAAPAPAPKPATPAPAPKPVTPAPQPVPKPAAPAPAPAPKPVTPAPQPVPKPAAPAPAPKPVAPVSQPAPTPKPAPVAKPAPTPIRVPMPVPTPGAKPELKPFGQVQKPLPLTVTPAPVSKPSPATPSPASAPAPTAKASGGYLGLGVADVQPFAEAVGLSDARGAFVKIVQPGASGQKSGIQAYDVIRRLNGQPIRNAADLIQRIAALPPGTKVNLRVWRNKTPMDIEVVLGARPEQEPASGKK